MMHHLKCTWLPGTRLLLHALVICAVLSGCGRTPVPAAPPTAVPAATMTILPLGTSTPLPTATEPAVLPAATPTVVASEPTATTVPTVTSEPTATETPVPSPTPTSSGASQEMYAIVGVAPDDVLNVRAGPGVSQAIVGTIPFYGMGVRVTGEGQDVAGSRWVPVIYGNVAGWVNSRFLARQVGRLDEQIVARAQQIVQALRDRDWATMARFVHPEKGVRFSPYAYVQAGPEGGEDQDLRFQAGEIETLAADPTIYRWERYDGTGEPIDLTFSQYVDRFVYDADFAQPDVVGYEQTVGQGNTINNISEVYPDAVTVEYHFTGFDPQYMGMDWRSLRLVLEKEDGVWYLVAIVHDEWTI